MKISGWGKYPIIETDAFVPLSSSQITRFLENTLSVIPRGLGRSYGDSSLASSIIQTSSLDHFIDFDQKTGVLRCYSGVSLAAILEVCVPKGWFLPVTPGTKFVTLGGAIASDVHGKNHHVEGCFSEHVQDMTVMVANGQVIACSANNNPGLFRATCGGMGLTGIILTAGIKLKPIRSSYIDQTILKAKNLMEVLELFEEYGDATYTVAWIDCLSTGNKLGRSLLMIGEHSDRGGLECGKNKALTIPFDMPSMLLNQKTVSLFNTLYYCRITRKITRNTIHYEPFFYPLDSLHDWNRIYGKSGFTQYQFVIPKEAGVEGVKTILERIAKSKRGSFLAVLKTFGHENGNYLSFPMEGYTLALDLKIDSGLFKLLNELDQLVLDYGGRIYLAKDVCMGKSTFKKSYPGLADFQKITAQYDPFKKFSSIQSERIGI